VAETEGLLDQPLTGLALLHMAGHVHVNLARTFSHYF
jgi:hypothetical protein